MSNDLIAKKKWATIYEAKNLDGNNDDCIRVYCSQAPDVFNFQIRTFKPITQPISRDKGKPRNMIATVSLSLTELEQILKYCKSRYPIAKRVNTKPLQLIKY